MAGKEIENKSDLVVTLTVTKEGKLGMQSNPSISDNEFRSVLLEAIIATIINNAVNATRDTMKADAESMLVNKLAGQIGRKQ